MVEEVSLRVEIDARPAAAGADNFKRSATEIIRNAEKLGRAVEKAGSDFDKMKKAANGNSRALAGTARSLRNMEKGFDRLSLSTERVKALDGALRSLSDSAGGVGLRLSDAAVSSNALAKSAGGKLANDVLTLSDLFIQLGLSIGIVSAASISFNAIKTSITIGRWVAALGKLIPAVGTAVAVIKALSSLLLLLPLGPIGVGFGVVAAGVLAFREATRKGRDAQREMNESLVKGNELLEKANGLSGDAKKQTLEQAAATLQNTLALKQEALARAEIEQQKQEKLIREGFGLSDPRFRPAKGEFDLSRFQLAGAQQELKQFDDKVAALDSDVAELIASISLAEREANRAAEGPMPESMRINGDDDRAGRLIENTNRSIELLNEQNSLIAIGATALAEQKAREAEIRERILALGLKEGSQRALELEALLLEKDRLEQVNKTLKDQAELRQRTEDDTDKLNARAAALDDLARKLDGSGLSAAEMQVEIDLLNSAVAAGVDLTKQWGQEWLDAQRNLKVAEKSVEDLRETQRKVEDDAKKRQEDADAELARRKEAVEDVFADIRNAAKDSIKDVIKGTESLADAFQNLADRITDILLDLALEELLGGGTGFSDVFTKLTGGTIGGAANDNKAPDGPITRTPDFNSARESGGGLLSGVLGVGGSGLAAPLSDCCERFETVGTDILRDMGGIGDSVAGKLGDTISTTGFDFANDVGNAIETNGQDFTSSLDDVFSNQIGDLSSILASVSGSSGGDGGSLIGSIFTGALGLGGTLTGQDIFTGGAPGAGTVGGLLNLPHGSPFHDGGVVGLDGRPVRYHTGGISGLRPDEVPAILQRGEEVLTANDPRHRDNGGGRGGAAGGVVVHNHFPNARNTQEAREAGSEIAAKTAAAAQRGMLRKGIG